MANKGVEQPKINPINSGTFNQNTQQTGRSAQYNSRGKGDTGQGCTMQGASFMASTGTGQQSRQNIQPCVNTNSGQYNSAQGYVRHPFSHGNGDAISGQNSSYTNGQPQSWDPVSDLADMISRMNNDFMGRLNSIEQNLSTLGQIEIDISLMRSDVSNIKSDNTEFNK